MGFTLKSIVNNVKRVYTVWTFKGMLELLRAFRPFQNTNKIKEKGETEEALSKEVLG